MRRNRELVSWRLTSWNLQIVVEPTRIIFVRYHRVYYLHCCCTRFRFLYCGREENSVFRVLVNIRCKLETFGTVMSHFVGVGETGGAWRLQAGGASERHAGHARQLQKQGA
jgi:hypothetical protein